MARRNNEPISGADKAKVRVFYAEVEGNNESVQEAPKTMLAMSRPARMISDQKVNGHAPVLLQHGDVEVVEEATDQAEEVQASDEEFASPSARKVRGTGKKRDRNTGLSLVPNLNFMPKDQRSIKEFVADKSPKDDIETALTTVYYMRHMMALPRIGPAHVMTAFKEAGKSIPADVRQTIRNVKKSKMWINFTDIDDVHTTSQGDNHVEHEMGKANSH